MTFIRWSFGTLAFVAMLAFVYLALMRPAPRDPVATTGDWITIHDLEARDRKLSPATEAAVQMLRASIDGLRAELSSRDARSAEDRATVLDTITRIEAKSDRMNERIDRLFEANVAKPPR